MRRRCALLAVPLAVALACGCGPYTRKYEYPVYEVDRAVLEAAYMAGLDLDSVQRTGEGVAIGESMRWWKGRGTCTIDVRSVGSGETEVSIANDVYGVSAATLAEYIQMLADDRAARRGEKR